MNPKTLWGAGVLLLAIGAAGLTRYASKPETEMHMAARHLLASLKPEQSAKAAFPFNSEERLNWHYVPQVRGGIPFKELDSHQRELALNLLRASLSQRGFQKVETIRTLENVLRMLEQGKGPTRDPELYYFAVFGEPSESGTWGWRCEGHHVSLNFTVVHGKTIATSPQFLGSNPGEVMDGPLKGTRVLAAEEDLARSLVKSLADDQRKEALLSDKAPADILTNSQRQAAIQDDRGILYSRLTREQQGLLLQIIREYAGVQRPELARERLEKVRKAGLEAIRFAWMGGLERGQGHYYRIQGRTFLIEYDNTQNNANHVHSVWRDFRGDWGADLLAEHYREFRHTAAGHVPREPAPAATEREGEEGPGPHHESKHESGVRPVPDPQGAS